MPNWKKLITSGSDAGLNTLTVNTVSASNITNVDYIDFDTTANPSHLEGRIHWDDVTKTIQIDTDKLGFSIDAGHQSVVRVYNNTGADIQAGRVVYINGAQGNVPTVATASWEIDPSSAGTIGFAATLIPGSGGNRHGYVITSGLITNINTNGFAVSDRLFLSSSGQFTNVAPDAPLHEVRLGVVVVNNATTGVIFVNVINGFELTELHDVKTTTESNGDLLVQSGSLWINSKQLTGSYSLTGSLITSGSQTISGSLVITNNLTVLGSSSISYVSESTLNIETNLITVNTYNPGARFGGLAVIDSGSVPKTSGSLLYDSIQDEWVFLHRGNGTNITSSHVVMGPETIDNFGNEIYLTANRLPKGTGNEHLNDSNISDNGTIVSINSNTQITGSLNVSNGVTASLQGTSSWATNVVNPNPVIVLDEGVSQGSAPFLNFTGAGVTATVSAGTASINIPGGGGGGGTDSWIMMAGFTSTTLNGNETYCYGHFYNQQPVTIFNARPSRQMIAPKTGFVKRVSIMTSCASFSTTSPPDSMQVQLRNVTQSTTLTIESVYTMSSLPFFGQSRQNLYTGFNFAVTQGDVLEMRLVAPNWATAPTGVNQAVQIFFENV